MPSQTTRFGQEQDLDFLPQNCKRRGTRINCRDDLAQGQSGAGDSPSCRRRRHGSTDVAPSSTESEAESSPSRLCAPDTEGGSVK